MKLIKHFDFTKETKIDESIWNIAVGDKWANSELQHYVNKSKNLFFDNGLVLRATLDNGVYESARLNTRDKFSFKYGKIEIIAKLPKGKGTWPALWMLSEKNPYGRWPRSGEIDIMEHVGRNEDEIFLCLHSEKYNHTNNNHFSYELKIDGATNGFHKYAIDWKEDSITYYIDDKKIITYSKNDKADASVKGWPFDHEYFFIMNLAIGGKFGGAVDDSIFPVDFIIKDIKIYKN